MPNASDCTADLTASLVRCQQCMTSCLSNKPAAEKRRRNASTASCAVIPASPRIRSATSEKAASSGGTRRRVRVGLRARGGQKQSPIRSYAPMVNKASAPSWAIYLVPFAPEYRESRRAPLLTGFLLPHMTFYSIENRGHREYLKD